MKAPRESFSMPFLDVFCSLLGATIILTAILATQVKSEVASKSSSFCFICVRSGDSEDVSQQAQQLQTEFEEAGFSVRLQVPTGSLFSVSAALEKPTKQRSPSIDVHIPSGAMVVFASESKEIGVISCSSPCSIDGRGYSLTLIFDQ